MQRHALQTGWFVLALLGAAACGGKARREPPASAGGSSGAGSGPTMSAVAGSANEGESAAAAGTGSGECPPPPLPAPPAFPGGPPSDIGCASETAGVWQEEPCSCELWLRSTSASPLETTLSFSYTPTDMAPTLTDAADAVEAAVDFEDDDGAWYDAWSAQSGNGTSFAVGRNGTTTSVRLATTNLTLDPVALPACARQTATATVRGPWGVELSLAMSATLRDETGSVVGTSTGTCFQPASHPTPQ